MNLLNWFLLVACGLLMALGIISLRAGSRKRTTTWGLALYVGLGPLLVVLPFFWQSLRLFSLGYALLIMAAGALAIVGIWAAAEAMRRGPVGPTFLMQNFSLLIPVTGSIIFYGEAVSHAKVSGLIVIAIAAALLSLGRGRSANRSVDTGGFSPTWLLYALMVFLFVGLTGLVFRDATFRSNDKEFYMGVVLLAYMGNMVGVIGGLTLSRHRPTRDDLVFGSATGFANLAAFIITLFLLRNVGGVVAFPTRYVISTLVVVVLASMIFRERPDARTIIGLAIGFAGVILLGL